jgi:hypothetical protein
MLKKIYIQKRSTQLPLLLSLVSRVQPQNPLPWEVELGTQSDPTISVDPGGGADVTPKIRTGKQERSL